MLQNTSANNVRISKLYYTHSNKWNDKSSETHTRARDDIVFVADKILLVAKSIFAAFKRARMFEREHASSSFCEGVCACLHVCMFVRCTCRAHFSFSCWCVYVCVSPRLSLVIDGINKSSRKYPHPKTRTRKTKIKKCHSLFTLGRFLLTQREEKLVPAHTHIAVWQRQDRASLVFCLLIKPTAYKTS